MRLPPVALCPMRVAAGRRTVSLGPAARVASLEWHATGPAQRISVARPYSRGGCHVRERRWNRFRARTRADAPGLNPLHAALSLAMFRTATNIGWFTLTTDGLLVNGGFEAAQDGMPAGWHSYGGTLTQVDQPVREGQFAACLYSVTSSTKWLYQTVPVEPAGWYEMSAYVYDDDPAVDAAWLRISWYESQDGSGSALWTVDSTNALSTRQAAYRLLATGAVQAPPNANSANARVLLRPVSAAPATICVDDASLIGAAPLPTATPTDTPRATAPETPTATPSQPARGVPSSTATRTPTGLRATPVRTVTSLPTTTARPHGRQPTPSPTPPATPSNGLLVNGGFESGLASWRTYGGALSQVASPVLRGQYAGAFSSVSGSTSWAYQTVAVEPSGWYELSGYIYQDDANVEAAFLRVSWYVSS